MSQHGTTAQRTSLASSAALRCGAWFRVSGVATPIVSGSAAARMPASTIVVPNTRKHTNCSPPVWPAEATQARFERLTRPEAKRK